ncbi:magnesium transporter NIPA-domain-containing protein [Lipomyces kononenkoae]|uniref:Magnesium transporter NIPA-domain-containing protein n=1 Tax=Lipomyces kononenkoae TaxID=34357 RepID=A0ACC3T979_LIPKO
MSDSIGFIPGDGDNPGRTSTVVGISTAIIGNVIISIALNLQRYAHLTLKERSAAEEAEQYNDGPSGEYGRPIDAERAYTDDETTGAFGDLERGPSAMSPLQNGECGYQYDAIPRSQQSTSESPVMPGTPATYDTASLLSKSNEDDVRLLQTNKQGTIWYSVKNVKDNTTGLPRSDSMQSTVGAEESTERLPKYMKSGSWWLGIALMAIGETGNFLAYGFAPASTVSPLGVVALISNCIVAPIFFGEHFRLRDVAGVVVAIAGAVTVVFGSNAEEEFLDPQRILNAVAQMSFTVYVGVTLFLIAGLSVLSNKYGDRLIFIDIALVALFGGYTALSTKAVSSLLSCALYRAFTFPITYGLVFVLVFTAIMQVKYLSRALQRFESTQVIPTHFVFFTISVILGSAILYQDFNGASTAQLVQFGCGCFLTFIGVYLITSNRNNEDGASKKSATHLDSSEDSDFFSTVASVNLDRSSGARTPTSFYEEDEDAQEIHDANATATTVNSRTRVNALLSSDEVSHSGSYPIPSHETNPLFSFLAPSKYGSSPGTSSRSYVPGPAGMGLIMDSVVRDRMKSWQMNQQRRRLGERRKRIASKATTIDSRHAPLYRVQTRGDEE